MVADLDKESTTVQRSRQSRHKSADTKSNSSLMKEVTGRRAENIGGATTLLGTFLLTLTPVMANDEVNNEDPADKP